MFSILVKPLGEKDIWMTRFKRPIENLVIKRYLKKQVNK
jgi:predicted HAD superfamily phosphohydrolase YqeG